MRVAALLLCLAQLHCSFGGVKGPRAGDPERPCTTDKTWPVVDGALAAGYGVITVGVATTSKSDWKPLGVMVFGALAAAHAIAGIHGAYKVSACRDREERKKLELQNAALPAATGSDTPPDPK